MKKITCFLLSFAIISLSAVSAQDFYLKGGLGYAFAMPGQKIDQSGNVLNGTVTYAPQGVADYHIKNASFTSGVQGLVGIGLMLSKNVGVELSASADLAPRTYTEIKYN